MKPLACLAVFLGACAHGSPPLPATPPAATRSASVAVKPATSPTRPAVAVAKVDFGQQVKPFFEYYCSQCHGGGRQRGGVRLDVKANAMLHITPGSPARSDVYRAITRASGASDHMPPLSVDQPDEDELAMIKQWISEGASWTDNP